MPTYRQHQLTAEVPKPPEPLAAPLTLLKKSKLHETQRSLGTQLGPGRRVLGRYSLDGATGWLVRDGVDTTSEDRIYPDATTPRVVYRAQQIELSPGTLVRLDVVAAPSGPTQKSDGEGGFVLDEIFGQVRAVITYRAPDGVTTTEATAAIAIPGSEKPHAGVPQSVVGSLFVKSEIALPGPLADDPATAIDWTSVGVSVDIRLELVGSPRIVDVALVEHPHVATVDIDDEWPSNLYVDKNGNPLKEPPTDWPQTQATASDRGFGTVAIGLGIAAHGDLLGGPMAWWSSGTEHLDELLDWLSANEAPPFAVTGTLEKHLPTGELPDDNRSAWSTGSHGATLVQSGDHALGRRTAVAPVWIDAYMRCSGTGTAYATVKTSDWDSYELSTDSLAFSWKRVPGWIEVGANPEDRRPLRVFPRTSVGGIDCEVRYVVVSRRRP